jgi:hypothetical protein
VAGSEAATAVMGEAVVLAEAAVLESPWEIRLVWASVYCRGLGYTQPSVSVSVSRLEMPWQCPSPLETLWRWQLPSVLQLKSRLP